MKVGSPEWHKARRFKIGGSEIAMVLGLNPYDGGSRSDLYYRKIGLTLPPGEPTADMRRGIEQEAYIARKYASETSCKLRKGKRLTHPDYAWWWGTPDRFAIDGEGRPGIVEVKCPRPSVYWRYEREGVPAMYICQAHWYLMHPAIEWCDLYIYNIVDMERILLRFEPEPEIQAWMLAEAEKFVGHVRTETHPDYDVAPMEIKPRYKPEVKIVEGEDWQRVMGRLSEGQTALKTAQEFWDAAKSEAETLMGDDALVQGYGGRIASSWVDGRVILDEKRLQAEHPELSLDDYRRQGKPYRQTRVTPLKGE